jgi:hypothetical protein
MRRTRVAEEIKEIAWKVQHRLHKRDCSQAADSRPTKAKAKLFQRIKKVKTTYKMNNSTKDRASSSPSTHEG